MVRACRSGLRRDAIEIEFIHEADAAAKRRVMHGNHGRPCGGGGERRCQPGQTLCAQRAAVVTGKQSVDYDDAYWQILDHILQKAIICRQVRRHRLMIGERPFEFGAIIVIAGHDVAGHR